MVTITGLTRGSGDFNLVSANYDVHGFCWHAGFWRSLDDDDRRIYSYNLDGTTTGAPSTITNLPSESGGLGGITSDGPRLYVTEGGTTPRLHVRTGSTWTTHTISKPTGISNLTNPQSLAYDEDDDVLWIGWQGASGSNRGAIGSYTKTGSYRAGTGFQTHANQRLPNAMVWYEGYLITVDRDDRRFYVYETDGTLDGDISDEVSTRVDGMGKRNDRLYLADRSNEGVDVWDIEYTTTDTRIAQTITSRYNVKTDTRISNTLTSNYTVLQATGSGTIIRLETEDFELDDANTEATGITGSPNNGFIVVDYSGQKVYGYDDSGNRFATNDFDLHMDNDQATGITRIGSIYYVVDTHMHKIYRYHTSGINLTALDLDTENQDPDGITVANGRLYVVDSVRQKVYAYDTGGNRQETYEFDVDVDDIRGIGFANGRFFLADIHFNDRKINVYNEDGEHQPDESIDLGFANASGLFAADDGKIYIPGRVGTRSVRVFQYSPGERVGRMFRSQYELVGRPTADITSSYRMLRGNQTRQHNKAVNC